MHNSETCKLCRRGKHKFVEETTSSTTDSTCEYGSRPSSYFGACGKAAVARQEFHYESTTADMGGFYNDISYTWNVCERHLDKAREAVVVQKTIVVHTLL